MKYVKVLGLAVMAAMGLMAFIGAGSASATVLCSTTVEPCPAAQKWQAGQMLHLTLKPGTSAKLTTTAGETLDTCTSATVTATLEHNPGPNGTPTGPITSLIWGAAGTPCTFPTVTLVGGLGTLEIHKIAGTSNGTVTGKGQKVTINTVLFGSCVYGTGAGTDLGILTEGKPAVFDANAIVKKVEGGFACPETAKWVAEYVVTEPNTTLSVGNS